MPLHWKNYKASLPGHSPPQEQEALIKVYPWHYFKIVTPPFVYPLKVLHPQLLRGQYVLAAVNLLSPGRTNAGTRDLLSMFDADQYAHSSQLNSHERRGEGLICCELAHSSGLQGN